jgi:hypothetical protein
VLPREAMSSHRASSSVLVFALGALFLVPGTARAQLAASAAARAARAPSEIEIRVASDAGPEADVRIAPRPAIERCLARGRRRVPELGGTLRLQLRWETHALAVVLFESTFGDRRTDECVRRAVRAAPDLERRIGAREIVTVEVRAPTPARLCTPQGDDIETGGGRRECVAPDAVRARLTALDLALSRARVRRGETLEESCGFTHVTVWLDRRGRLVSYGVTSVNSDGESPEIGEYVAERAVALEVLAARVRPGRAAAVWRFAIYVGGCD